MSELKQKIVLIGAGGHARSVIDAIERMGSYEIAGLVDPDPSACYKRYKTIGDDGSLERIFDSGVLLAAMGVGYMGKSSLRERLYARAKEIGFSFPAIVDPSSVIANDVVMGEGVFVGKLAVVNSNACLGKMAIVNTGAIIEHDCTVSDFSHIAVNTTLCGSVMVEKRAFIGANATVIQGITIGENALVGAGATVLSDVEDGQRVVGIHGR